MGNLNKFLAVGLIVVGALVYYFVVLNKHADNMNEMRTSTYRLG